MTPYYFGCWDNTGHHMHDIHGKTVYHQRELPPSFPWDINFCDSGLLTNGKKPDIYNGKVYWVSGGRETFWYAFVWWDNSVDRRPGSNSGIYVPFQSLGKQDDMLLVAKKSFPHVIQRQRQPLILRP